MITPAEIKKKVLRLWDSGRFISAWCCNKNIFPVNISFGKTGGSTISENFIDTRNSISVLSDSAKDKTGSGYSIEYKTVSHRQLGRQNIPCRIFIETEDDFLKLCGKKKEFDNFRKAYVHTQEKIPHLCRFMQDKPMQVIDNLSIWDKLIPVCLYFINNPKPGLYIRQIVIPGIDTKFIEANKKIIADILIYLDPVGWGSDPIPLSNHGFEKHFGLLFDEPLIRFRILDRDLFINDISDLTLPLSQFSSIDIKAEIIFITENKINGLAFPMTKKSIVIFGLGYGIQALRQIPWMQNRQVFYWGDIDTHGFSILSTTKNILPGCRSMLMDEETLNAHMQSCVREPDSKRFTGELSFLNEEEKAFFEKLKSNNFGENLRLEQELVGFDYLKKWLSDEGLDASVS